MTHRPVWHIEDTTKYVDTYSHHAGGVLDGPALLEVIKLPGGEFLGRLNPYFRCAGDVRWEYGFTSVEHVLVWAEDTLRECMERNLRDLRYEVDVVLAKPKRKKRGAQKRGAQKQ